MVCVSVWLSVASQLILANIKRLNKVSTSKMRLTQFGGLHYVMNLLTESLELIFFAKTLRLSYKKHNFARLLIGHN